MIEKFKTLQQLLEKYPKIEIGKAEDLTNFVPVNNLIPICRVKKHSDQLGLVSVKFVNNIKYQPHHKLKMQMRQDAAVMLKILSVKDLEN